MVPAGHVRRAADHRRHRRRPAGGAVRPGLPPRRHGEEHLRHRLLHADAHRRQGGRVEARPDHHRRARRPRGKEFALEGSVFIGGAVVQWLRDGLGILQQFGRDRALGRERARQRRRLSRARPSPAWARRIGTRTRAARSSASRAEPRARTSPARRSNRSPSRAPSCSRRCRRTRGQSLMELRVDGGAAANDLLMQFQADLLGVPVVRPKVHRDHRARRRLPRRPHRRSVEVARRARRALESRQALRAAAWIGKTPPRMARWREAVGALAKLGRPASRRGGCSSQSGDGRRFGFSSLSLGSGSRFAALFAAEPTATGSLAGKLSSPA